jgi:predicted heme/steroid binding protein
MPILLGKEEKVIERIEELIEKEEKSGEVFTMTLAELAEMDGKTETTPIYLAIKGHIYDLTAGREVYGPGKSYSNLVAKDSTRGFANGCTEDKCLGSSLEGLTEEQLKEVDKWHDFYHNHDKYKYVGKVALDPVDAVIELEFTSGEECNSPECQTNTIVN